MGTFKMRHVRYRNGAYYFEAMPSMRKAGIHSETLGPHPGPALARAKELLDAWDEESRGIPVTPDRPNTIGWLITEFEGSDWYEVLGAKTKLNADLALFRVRDAMGGKAIRAVRRGHCRRFHKRLVERRGRNAANEGIKWLRRIFSYATELEIIETNPAAKMGLKQPPRRIEVWTREEVEAFIAKAIENGRWAWALAVRIAYDTSQRLADVLSLTWHQYDGEGLTFRQAKTGEEVWVPLTTETRAMLAETSRVAIHIIVVGKPHRPISHGYFGRVFRGLRAKTDMRQHLRFRDLRRTAATEIDAGGGNIEPITGLRPGSPAKRHYVVPSKDAAREAQRARTKRQRDSER